MHRTSRASVLLLLALLATPASGNAAVPSPFDSFVSPCFVVCPAGDIVFRVEVRDLAHNPVAGANVVINLCGCPAIQLCPPVPSDPYTVIGTCTLQRVADANGVALFPIRAGGVCATSAIVVTADGVVLASRFGASTDQDGDLAVGMQDDAIMLPKRGSSDPTGDLDCSGVVDVADRSILFHHLGHTCLIPTGVDRPGWGRLKVRYR